MSAFVHGSDIVGGADLGDALINSARFDGGADTTHAAETADSTQIFTIVCWFKPLDGLITANGGYFYGTDQAGTNGTVIGLNTAGQLIFQHHATSVLAQATSDAVFADPSEWTQAIIAVDTTQATQANRCRMWANGVELAVTQGTAIPLNQTTYIGSNNYTFAVGSAESGAFYRGFMAGFYYLDGIQNTDPTNVGRFSADYPWLWVNASYAGAYGTKGRQLLFATNTNYGDDTSGNALDCTDTGFDTGDQMLDAPENNYPIWNLIDENKIGFNSDITFTEGGLGVTAGNGAGCKATQAIPDGDWYMEVDCTDVAATKYGVAQEGADLNVSGATNLALENCYNVGTGNKIEWHYADSAWRCLC